MNRYQLSALALLGAMTAGCADATQSPTAPARVDADILVPALQSSVDQHGQFRLRREPEGELTEASAKALAAAYMRQALPWIIGTWEEDRKAPIDLRSLVVCERAFYAASPYESLAPDVELHVRMYFSARWLVGACTPAGTQVGSISVASQATHLTLENGRMMGDRSNVFMTSGVPIEIASLPMTPEEAASTVARGTGERIAALPELVLNHPLLAAPQLAKWRMGVERPVGVMPEGAGAPVSVSSLYYGFGSTWRFKALLIDGHTGVDSRPYKYHLPNGDIREVILKLRPGYTDTYLVVRVEG